MIDFGVASLQTSNGQDTTRLTQKGQWVDVLRYASPEQLTGGKQFGPHNDVFGLGGVLFTALTNRPPNEGATLSAVLISAAREPRWPSKRFLPIELERVGRRALARELDQRYASAEEFQTALENWLATQS